jgi:hypothetical protein
MRMQKIIMVNDTVSINRNYREKLYKRLCVEFKNVSNIGLFDDKFISKFKFTLLTTMPSVFIISSNLKSNIFSLIHFWTKGVVILNGMGRYRYSKILRIILIILFKINFKKIFIIQSYADYRYFNRHLSKNFHWIPGSGGVCKKIGPLQDILAVQRDDKLNLTGQNLLELSRHVGRKINIVGCTKNTLKNFPGFSFVGRVNPKDIFLSGGTFVQPKGYGEGFPHTLADAIVSDMKIYINSNEYVRYGLHKLGGKRTVKFKEWYLLEGANFVAQKVNEGEVVNMYFELIRSKV